MIKIVEGVIGHIPLIVSLLANICFNLAFNMAGLLLFNFFLFPILYDLDGRALLRVVRLLAILGEVE